MIDRPLQVLIVDDYRTMLGIIRNLLKQIDLHDVDEAADGTEALAQAAPEPLRYRHQ